MSSAASNISFDSTFSDTYPSYSQMPPIASETPIRHNTDLGEMHTSLPEISEGRETPRSGHTTPDDSFIRHHEYFFNDGNVTFLVSGLLWFVYITYLSAYRLVVQCTVSIGTSFLAIQSTFQHDLLSSAYVTTKLCLLSYQLATLNAMISRPSSPSYTLGELCWITVPTRLLSRLTNLQEF